ncbi:sigma-54 interaction domain-containing protein [Novosphingobium lentum]|uniref:sigma-54 interaction domain-containing protein n=1 Tax=Novosphingobium lentum TaxID=145287 RepID=UPI000AE50263|nr:sigma 54-interacting transcriptional regulator [Novosphingobium lentum]
MTISRDENARNENGRDNARGALIFAEGTDRRHAPLVQRMAAVIDSFGQEAPVQLRDGGNPTPAAARCTVVTLHRNAATGPAIERDGARRFTLRYDDGAGTAALAALLACSTRPGAPIAADPESLSVLALAERLAASEIPVLINGPTGTGKEVLSRFIHDRSPRRDKPFIGVNCAAMPETMLEALLFGHQKGSFTGANAASEGFFRAADGGTLLLDEIAEMPLALQAKLLRALQEGEVLPLGATQPIKVDVRVIACANRDLPTEVAEGRFRADLFYRLNVFPLGLRALCERREDIAPLAFALLLRHCPADRAVPWIDDAALAMLAQHPWPGNVRELENVVRRALLLVGDGTLITPEHIAFDRPARLMTDTVTTTTMAETATADGSKLSNIVQLSEARAIMDTLEACGGSRVAAARRLGISERTLRYRLASFRDAGIAMAGGRR